MAPHVDLHRRRGRSVWVHHLMAAAVALGARVRRLIRRLVVGEARPRVWLDGLSDLVLWVGPDGTVVSVDGNRGLLGSEDEPTGRDVAAVVPAFAHLPMPTRDGGPVRATSVSIRRGDGSTFIGDVTSSHGHEDGSDHLVVVIRDVTDRHLAEEELRLAAQRSAAANTALRAANARLELANQELARTAQLKHDFLSLTSHEFRTPLTPILGFSDLLLARWEELSDADRRSQVASIHRHAARLRVLVDNLLIVADGRQGALSADLRPTALGPLLDAIVSESSSDVLLDPLDDDVRVRAAPEQLGLAMRNLLSNAEAHGEPPYAITAELHPDWVDVRVSDQGGGMPPHLIDEMFEPFTQGSVGDRRTVSGLGIGLAVARTLVQLNDGTIWYEPGEVRGATFVIRLPRAR